MRTLIDLGNRVALITWHKKYLFSPESEKKYSELLWKRHSIGVLTDTEQLELNMLCKKTGKCFGSIDSIEIINGTKDESHSDNLVFTVPELKKIYEGCGKVELSAREEVVTLGNIFSDIFKK